MMTSIYYSDTPDGVGKQTTTYPLEETDEYYKYSYAKIVLNESSSAVKRKPIKQPTYNGVYEDDSTIKVPSENFGGYEDDSQIQKSKDKEFGYSDGTTTEDSETNVTKAPSKQELRSQHTNFNAQYFWNESFQLLLESPTHTPEQWKKKEKSIEDLGKEFSSFAVPIVEQLVVDLHKPLEEKRYQPIDAGGVAGGTKYSTAQMFFKFATDDFGIYGGDEYSGKAASAELRGVKALVSCNLPNLHFPFMLLVNCYGYRVICVSKLPISGSTLVYGSENGGVDIHDSYEMNKIMQKAAKLLNLKEHYVEERASGNKKLIYAAVDLEGHFGLDGRYYLIDTARLFPPMKRITGVKGCHLYKLFRGEFLKSFPKPLSSDVFSAWGKIGKEETEETALEAMQQLLRHVIPQFAKVLDKLSPPVKLTEEMHKRGINMRFLGLVLCNVSTHRAKQIVLMEMLSRAFKSQLNSKMRENSNRSAKQYMAIAQGMLQGLVDSDVKPTSQSGQLWNSLVTLIKERFFDHTHLLHPLSSSEQNQLGTAVTQIVDIRNHVKPKKNELLLRISALTGIIFTPTFHSKLVTSTPITKISVTDIQKIEHTVKYIEMVPFVSGTNLDEAEAFYLNELENRKTVLGTRHPQVVTTLNHLAELYSHAGKFSKAEERYLEAIHLLNQEQGQLAEKARFYESLGSLYDSYDKLSQAEEHFKSALKLKEEHYTAAKNLREKNEELMHTLNNLAQCYTKQHKFGDANVVYSRAVTLFSAVSPWEAARAMNSRVQQLLKENQNQVNEAEELLLKAMKTLEDDVGTAHSAYAIALDSLGKIKHLQQKYAEAHEIFQRALTIKEHSVSEQHFTYAISLDHSATNLSCLSESKLQEAQERYERALKLFEKIVGTAHSSVAIASNNMGTLLLKRGDVQAAREKIERAVNILRTALHENHPLLQSTKLNLELLTANKSNTALSPLFHDCYIGFSPERGLEIKIPPEWKQIFEEAGIDESDLTDAQTAQLIFQIISQMQPASSTPSESATRKSSVAPAKKDQSQAAPTPYMQPTAATATATATTAASTKKTATAKKRKKTTLQRSSSSTSTPTATATPAATTSAIAYSSVEVSAQGAVFGSGGSGGRGGRSGGSGYYVDDEKMDNLSGLSGLVLPSNEKGDSDRRRVDAASFKKVKEEKRSEEGAKKGEARRNHSGLFQKISHSLFGSFAKSYSAAATEPDYSALPDKKVSQSTNPPPPPPASAFTAPPPSLGPPPPPSSGEASTAPPPLGPPPPTEPSLDGAAPPPRNQSLAPPLENLSLEQNLSLGPPPGPSATPRPSAAPRPSLPQMDVSPSRPTEQSHAPAAKQSTLQAIVGIMMGGKLAASSSPMADISKSSGRETSAPQVTSRKKRIESSSLMNLTTTTAAPSSSSSSSSSVPMYRDAEERSSRDKAEQQSEEGPQVVNIHADSEDLFVEEEKKTTTKAEEDNDDDNYDDNAESGEAETEAAVDMYADAAPVEQLADDKPTPAASADEESESDEDEIGDEAEEVEEVDDYEAEAVPQQATLSSLLTSVPTNTLDKAELIKRLKESVAKKKGDAK